MLERGVSIVIPVFNSEKTLALLSETITSELNRLGVSWELILVDDGSTDESWNKITEIAKNNLHVSGIRLSQNFGQHPALLAGIRAAKYHVTVTMDDDLQHRPDCIANLLSELKENVSLVYGVALDEEHEVTRNLSSRISKWFLSSIIGMKQAANASAFRAFNTQLRDSWVNVSDQRISIDVLLSWAVDDYVAVSIPMDKRLIGNSNYTFTKLLKHLFNMIVGFSTRPLTAIALLGCTIGLVGFFILLWVLGQYFFGTNQVEGFTFLASLVSLMGGMQLVGIGIIGQYLGRIYERSMSKPVYQIKSFTPSDWKTFNDQSS